MTLISLRVTKRWIFLFELKKIATRKRRSLQTGNFGDLQPKAYSKNGKKRHEFALLIKFMKIF